MERKKKHHPSSPQGDRLPPRPPALLFFFLPFFPSTAKEMGSIHDSQCADNPTAPGLLTKAVLLLLLSLPFLFFFSSPSSLFSVSQARREYT